VPRLLGARIVLDLLEPTPSRAGLASGHATRWCDSSPPWSRPASGSPTRPSPAPA
jgi:hypothetical protein